MTAFIKYVTFGLAECEIAQGILVRSHRLPIRNRRKDDFAALTARTNEVSVGFCSGGFLNQNLRRARFTSELSDQESGGQDPRLIALGATKVEYREGHGSSWTVMLDPEGNELSVGSDSCAALALEASIVVDLRGTGSPSSETTCFEEPERPKSPFASLSRRRNEDPG